MTIGAILECSTCGHKIRLRYQVGYVYPVVAKIACNQCGKLIKGHIRKGDKTFDFPNDKVSDNYEETTQVVSFSSELPIALKLSNVIAKASPTPYLGIGQIVGFGNIGLFEKNLRGFIEFYDKKFHYLVTCSELFENKNWGYFHSEVKKYFKEELNSDNPSFESSCNVIVDLYKSYFKFLATEYYEIHFNQKLQTETINKVQGSIPQLKNLRALLETYINVELEFIKGTKLITNFLENVKSFLPVIVLSYKNDYTKQYLDEIGLTTFEFLDLKEMFIEQFEYLSRISSLYFGLINLADRNDYDDFGTIPDCNQLSDYFKKDNGIKKDIIKKAPILDNYFLDTLNSQLRNGIGHLKTLYDPKTQIIKYYPYKDPAKINTFKEIYLVDFAGLVYQQSLKVMDSLEILSRFVNLTK